MLTRENLGPVDEVEHLLFRMHLLREIQEQAAQLVVFPRPALEANLKDLLGVDLDQERDRITVVPEGIDPVPLDRAARDVAVCGAGCAGAGGHGRRRWPSWTSCSRRCRRSDAACRWRSPSVGCTRSRAWRRSSRPGSGRSSTGAATSWSSVATSTSPARTNAGSSASSTPWWVAAKDPGRACSWRDTDPTRRWRSGWPPPVRVVPEAARPAGSTCRRASRRSSASRSSRRWPPGWSSWRPWEGGPATYVEDGVTGVLVDTRVPAALAGAVVAALDLTAAPGAEDRAAGGRAAGPRSGSASRPWPRRSRRSTRDVDA